MHMALPQSEPPFLALLTEPDACDSDERMEKTLAVIRSAVGISNEPIVLDHHDNEHNPTQLHDRVDLVCIRVTKPDSIGNCESTDSFQNRVVTLTRNVMSLKKNKHDFIVVVNDNVDAAIASGADGVHVKERNVSDIPSIRKRFQQRREVMDMKSNDKERNAHDQDRSCSNDDEVIIGTSSHDVASALSTWEKYHPSYFFVGTCFKTLSHPEKAADDLEGPQLPGIIKSKISKVLDSNQSKPLVFAIGGIDASNCAVPIKFGADGVAAIRSLTTASDPSTVVHSMKKTMRK